MSMHIVWISCRWRLPMTNMNASCSNCEWLNWHGPQRSPVGEGDNSHFPSNCQPWHVSHHSAVVLRRLHKSEFNYASYAGWHKKHAHSTDTRSLSHSTFPCQAITQGGTRQHIFGCMYLCCVGWKRMHQVALEKAYITLSSTRVTRHGNWIYSSSFPFCLMQSWAPNHPRYQTSTHMICVLHKHARKLVYVMFPSKSITGKWWRSFWHARHTARVHSGNI